MGKRIHVKQPALLGWNTFFFVLAVIALIGLGLYLVGPYLIIIPYLIGFFLMVFQGVFIFFTTVFSIGYVWQSEPYKEFNNLWYQLWIGIFEAKDVLTPLLAKTHIYALQISGVVMLVSLFFAILSVVFYKKKAIGLLIAIIALILFAVAVGYFILKQYSAM